MKINIEPNLISSETHLFSFPYNQFVNSALFIKSLEIPLLQRDYIWSDTQINDLIDDLDDYLISQSAVQPNDRYFEGTILLEQGEINSDKYFIIDGQQRITTVYLFLFLGYLLSRYRAVHIPPGLQGNARAKAFIKRVEKFIYFENRLLLNKNPSSKIDPLLDSSFDSMTELEQTTLFEKRLGLGNYENTYWNSFNLRLASSDAQINSSLQNFIQHTKLNVGDGLSNIMSENTQYFKNVNILFQRLFSNNNTGVEDKVKGDMLETIEKYIDKCGFNTVISENRDDSFTLFEVLNDRGADLTALDLIKNEILKNFGNNVPLNFINNWESLKSNLSNVYGRDTKKISAHFVNDVTRSEGSEESNRYFTYLSLKGVNQPANKPSRHLLFRNESNVNFAKRLIEVSELLKILKQQNNAFDSSINGSCFQYVKLMAYLKYHWGTQLILGSNIIYLISSNYSDTLSNTRSGTIPWRNTTTTLSNAPKEHFIRYLGDIILKAGIIGLSLDLQTSVLPTFSRVTLIKIIEFCNTINNPTANDYYSLINQINTLFSTTFLTRNNITNFENRVKAFSYNITKEKSLIKVILYLIYNHGGVAYRCVDPELEHLEPTNPVSGTNPYFQDPNRNNIINGIGNMFLIEKNDNIAVARNKPIIQKIIDLQATGKAIYNHDLFKNIHPNQNPINSSVYGPLPVISQGGNQSDSFNVSGAPKRIFFEKRAEMYSLIAKDKICDTLNFLDGSGLYIQANLRI